MPPIWAPSAERVGGANLTSFLGWLGEHRSLDLRGYEALHAWSTADPGAFWDAAWEHCGVVGERGEVAFLTGESLPTARFFPEGRLNVVETFLATTGDGPALVEAGEDGRRRTLSWDELRGQAAAMAAACWPRRGSAPDTGSPRWLPNIPETIVTMLATAAVGATFSSTSPDFGPAGVLDRFGQIEPTVLVAADGYVYGGKANDCLPRLAEIRAGLPSVERTIVVPYLGAPAPHGVEAWPDVLAAHRGTELVVERHPFDHPWYVLYSSGTTGKPKAIVHRTGGVLLKHLVEHQLHCDVHPGDPIFYFTTAGWMMWNWLASGLASGATLVLYDGSPSHPLPVLFDLADEQGRDPLRDLGQVHRRPRPQRPRPGHHPRPHLGADDHLHRLTPGARGLRLRVRAREGRRAPGVHLGGHRPLRVPRGR